MKKNLLIAVLWCLTITGFSQQNMITLSGGYVASKLDASELTGSDEKIKGSGWRINGSYEFNPHEGKIAYGFAIGYLSVGGNDNSGLDTVDYKVSSVPLYFVPKYIFGKNKIRGFVKGALGFQSSRLDRNGPKGTVEATDFGFYGGLGAGMLIFLNDKIFLNAEYEFAYMSNSYYVDGLLHSVMLGVGIKF